MPTGGAAKGVAAVVGSVDQMLVRSCCSWLLLCPAVVGPLHACPRAFALTQRSLLPPRPPALLPAQTRYSSQLRRQDPTSRIIGA